MIGSVLHPAVWVLRRFKNDGELTVHSFLNLPLFLFFPMAQDSVSSVTASRSSLEQDYEYDKDNDVFLFYPPRPAFESSRDKLFLPVRVSPGASQDEANHSVSIPQLSTTSRCSETTG
jgi:hypothetical protein